MKSSHELLVSHVKYLQNTHSFIHSFIYYIP